MITLDRLTKRYGPKILFENVSMRFDPGKRYVLVGAPRTLALNARFDL